MGLYQLPENGPPSLEFMLEPQHGQRNLFRLWAGQTHHADAAASGRRGDGNDGVVEVHEAILAVKLEAQPAAELSPSGSAQGRSKSCPLLTSY